MNQDQEQSGEHLIPENSYYHPLIAFWMPQRFALKAITQFKMRNSTFKSTARLWGLKMPVAMPIQPQAKQTVRLNIVALSSPPQWWRYRDDIFYLWQQGLAALNSFTEYINSLYPTIKFELDYSESNLNVSDVSLHLVDGFIQTDFYSNPTDSHLYLSPSSAHPTDVFKAIPFGVASRLRRNCSEDNFLKKRLEEYKGYLIGQFKVENIREGSSLIRQFVALSFVEFKALHYDCHYS